MRNALLALLPLLACSSPPDDTPGETTTTTDAGPVCTVASDTAPCETTNDPGTPTTNDPGTTPTTGDDPATTSPPSTTDASTTDASTTSEPGTTDPGTTDPGTTGEPGETTLGDLLTADLFAQMFPNHDPLYTYEALLAAAAEYPAFVAEGSADERRRELAAFLANAGHETTGGWPDAPGGPQAWGLYFTEEVGCEDNKCPQYCDANNAQYPCAPGKTYHGRGPIQLSWNYNYGAVGDVIGEPLLANPELVASDGAIAFRTALWFWMTAQAPKPSAHDVMVGAWQPTADDQAKGRAPGFGMTINIINGGIECGKPSPPQVLDRVAFYQRFTDMLGVDPGAALYCDGMQPY